MSTTPNEAGHFMASIEIEPHGPAPDRRTHPASNFMRWAFIYSEDENILGDQAPAYDIWPEFLDEKECPISDGVSCIGTFPARMHIINHDLVPKHFSRFKIGTKFYCKDGTVTVATGTVIQLSG